MAEKRIEIEYFDGINSFVSHNVASKRELRYAENARSVSIGAIEKRQGYSTLTSGTESAESVNLLTYFKNTLATNTGVYRVVKAANSGYLQYFDTSNLWQTLTGLGTGLMCLGSSNTYFNITKTGSTITYTYTVGTDPLIGQKVNVGDVVTINAEFFSAANKGTATVIRVSTNSFTVAKTGGVIQLHVNIGTGSIIIKSAIFSSTIAEGNLFLVDGIDNNRYVQSDGTTVIDSSTTTGNLNLSPVAKKINYYKDRLYLANLRIGTGTQKYKNYVMFSSPLLGIISLVDGDHTNPVTSLKVTDTKYIHSTDTLQVYCGGVLKTFDLGSATTQFDITGNPLTTMTYTWDQTGVDPTIGDLDSSNIGDTIEISATTSFSAGNRGSFVIKDVGTNYFSVINPSGVAETKTTGPGYIRVGNSYVCDFRWVSSTTIFVVTNVSGDIWKYTWTGAGFNPHIGSSACLTVGDEITISGTNMSAGNQGTFTLTGVGGNYFEITNALGVVESDKTIGNGYIRVNTISVKTKTEDTLTIKKFNAAINSSEELWINGTYTGERKFRWASNPSGGVDVKQYDSFKLTGTNDNDEDIKMLANIGDVEVIANNNNLAYWNDSNLKSLDLGIGCVSPRGYVKTKGLLFFIHYTGIYVISGADTPKLISSKVDEYITGATTAGLEATAMGKKGLSIFAYIGTVTLYKPDGSVLKTLSNVVLEYNIRQENWFVHTGIPASEFTTYVTSTNPDKLLFAHNTNFTIEEFLTGNADGVGGTGMIPSTGNAIPFSIKTPYITLSPKFEVICYPKRIIVETEEGNGIKGFISLDGDDYYEIKGEAKKGCTILTVVPKHYDFPDPSCRQISVAIKEMSMFPCKVSRIAIEYTDEDVSKTYST